MVPDLLTTSMLYEVALNWNHLSSSSSPSSPSSPPPCYLSVMSGKNNERRPSSHD